MGNRLPGEKEAFELGYRLHYYCADRVSWATYLKDEIFLVVWEVENCLRARLDCIYKMLVIKTPDFSFPNKNFQVFEGQIIEVKNKLEGKQ